MKMTGAIFDMDGTLLDSMPIWDRVGIDYLAGLGIQARPDLPERLLTMSMRQAAAYFRSGYGVNLPEAEIMDGINARIEAFYRKRRLQRRAFEIFARASAIGCENVRGNGDRPPFGRSRIAAHRAAQLFFLPSHLHRGGLRQGQSGYFCIGTEKTGHTAGTDGGL